MSSEGVICLWQKTIIKREAMIDFGTYEPLGQRLCYRPPVPPFPKLEDVWDALRSANQSVEAFDRALEAFPVRNLVGKLFARLDAVHSSGAEGSTTTFTDLMEYQTALRRAPDPNDAMQVQAAAIAFDDLCLNLPDPIAAIRQIHKRLFEHSTDPLRKAQAGQIKNYPNGTMDPEAPSGIFHYCAPASVDEALREWSALTLADDGGPELLRQALSHWMFEHIHPVNDGNGRIGRLLVPLLMRRKGALNNACAFFGEAVYREKDIYVEALKNARRSGDMTAWCRTFCFLVAQTACDNLERTRKLGELYADWRKRARSIRSHSVAHHLLPWITVTPRFTVKDALTFAASTGNRVTFAAMNAAISRIKDLGIVALDGAAQSNRLFSAPEVMSLFEVTKI